MCFAKGLMSKILAGLCLVNMRILCKEFSSDIVLLRFKQLLVYGPPWEKNGLVGPIVLYVLLRVDTMFNKMISDFLRSSSFPMSGWKKSIFVK